MNEIEALANGLCPKHKIEYDSHTKNQVQEDIDQDYEDRERDYSY